MSDRTEFSRWLDRQLAILFFSVITIGIVGSIAIPVCVHLAAKSEALPLVERE